MILKIQTRTVVQSRAVRGGRLIEHLGSGFHPTCLPRAYHDRSAPPSATRSLTPDALPSRPRRRFQQHEQMHPMVAQTTPTIDVHAHILTEETIRLLHSEAPKVAPKLSDIDEQFGTLDVAGSVYRHFPRGGWDLERRLQDMAASKVDVQVLSVCPQTFVYAQPPALAAAFARIQNEQLAKLVKARPDRFLAIATLPMQAPKLAADELRHAMRGLGLSGAQIGSKIAGKNLDDPELEPVWATAAEPRAFILVHPINGAGRGGRARGGEEEAAEAADGFARSLPLRHHHALERRARVPGRQCGRRPRAAGQRLSLRHGHAGWRAAGGRAVDSRGRAGGHSRRPGTGAARRRRRHGLGARHRLKRKA